MGWNDRMEDSELANLPPEAFGPVAGPFDPVDFWLERADKDDQITAMREWFYARYCDPAHETPYDGREGGYLFVDGGPYDPADVLPERFSGIVDDDLIQEVIDEMHTEVGDRWAPITDRHFDDFEYDDRLDLTLLTRDEPLNRLNERLHQAHRVLTLQGDEPAKLLAQKLVFGAVIGALEAFFWETVEYWVAHDERAFRNIVTRIPAIADQPMKLGEIFEKEAGLKEYVKGYLQNLVWHRWEKVAPLFKFGLEIQPPSFKPFEEALLKRHDIVHRSGHDKAGNAIIVTDEEINALCEMVLAFATEIEQSLAQRAAS